MKLSERVNKFVSSRAFSGFILFVVFVNSVVLGLQTSSTNSEDLNNTLSLIDKVCLWIFVAEAALKIFAWRKSYFTKGWNWFDFIIVAFSLLSDVAAFSSIRAFRIIRVFRSLKFISSVKNLQVIVAAIGHSIPSIGWTGLLMLLVYYIFAVIGTMLYSSVDPENFGSLGNTMFSLFQVMTLEDWSDICRGLADKNCSFVWVYFITFVILSSFVILNIVVGIVVNSISEVTQSKKSEKNTKLTEEEAILKEIQMARAHLDRLQKMVEKIR